MAADRDESGQKGGKDRKRPDDRERRLAAALRANLHRRKAQARERSNAADAAGGDDGRDD